MMNDEIVVKSVQPKSPHTFTFEDIFDGDDDYIKEELAKQDDPSLYLNERAIEYLADTWDVEDILGLLMDYVRFEPIESCPKIVDMPEKFY